MISRIKSPAKQICIATLCSLFVYSSALASEPMPIKFNFTEKTSSSLAYKVLELAVGKLDNKYELQGADVVYPNTNAEKAALAEGKIDIRWGGATKVDDTKFKNVPFPIDGGLLGYRLFLIDGERQAEFSAIQSLEDLESMIAIQGPGWGDIGILENAGLTVRTGPYNQLFKMTVGGRADYFPRAAFEAIAEQAANVDDAPGLAVEKSLIVHYPLTWVYTVSADRKGLYDDIMKGLYEAYDDGSYKKLLLSDANVKLSLEQGNLNGRKVIELPNPNMPEEIKAIPEKYWFKPQNNSW
ncbi:hypothetical protein HPDFL43_04710 [Hoeflea phototrophica DFL-43]|jgi:hypothetical protein|uniref:ABC-type amino acid transport/signal transduction system, periplasmic component/domain protein n=2 Tax=Hoeflea TaxID=274591 RepID=A9D3R3_HOEPD|nr:hypothetical protein HPDFL43_04710 [Hoeflea phototrophica DFL-43]